MFGDGHDKVACAILWRRKGIDNWDEAPLHFVVNDRWRGHFTPTDNAPHEYTIIAWRDEWATWRSDTAKKHNADVPIALELQEGAELVARSVGAGRGTAEEQATLKALAEHMRDASDSERFAVHDDGRHRRSDAARRPSRRTCRTTSCCR